MSKTLLCIWYEPGVWKLSILRNIKCFHNQLEFVCDFIQQKTAIPNPNTKVQPSQKQFLHFVQILPSSSIVHRRHIICHINLMTLIVSSTLADVCDVSFTEVGHWMDLVTTLVNSVTEFYWDWGPVKIIILRTGWRCVQESLWYFLVFILSDHTPLEYTGAGLSKNL